MTKLAVYCGSAPGHDPAFTDAARLLGTLMAQHNIGLVFGGGHIGLMGVIADAMLAGGGSVDGVIPRDLVARELAHEGCTRLHVVETMHERKAQMAILAQGFIALPGGFGTLDEMFEMLTWGQLGYHAKPCVFLNIAGYFDPLIAFADSAVVAGFLSPTHRALMQVADTPEAALALLPPSRLREGAGVGQ